MIYMKKRFENGEAGIGTSWKKELGAWILKWNILRSNKFLLTSSKSPKKPTIFIKTS
jgi:hypothetical protein